MIFFPTQDPLKIIYCFKDEHEYADRFQTPQVFCKATDKNHRRQQVKNNHGAEPDLF